LNEVDAMALANQLDTDCSFQLQRYDPPQARSLKDFGIDKEGYGVFCEGFRNYKSILQSCIITFMKPRRLKKEEIGNDAILFEKE
jgi:hypothetical protein